MSPSQDAVHNRAEEKTAQKKKDLLRKLAELQNALTQKSLTADLETLQAYTLQEIARFISCQAYALILVDAAGVAGENRVIRRSISAKSPGVINGDLNPANKTDHSPKWAYEAGLNTTQGLIQECLHTQKTLLIADVTVDLHFDPESDAVEDIQIQSMLCVPLIVNAKSLGVIQVVNKLVHSSTGAASSIGAFNREEQDILLYGILNFFSRFANPGKNDL